MKKYQPTFFNFVKTITVNMQSESLTSNNIKSVVISYFKENNVEIYSHSYERTNIRMGFMGDYYKLRVQVRHNEEIKDLYFFVKTISKSDICKGTMLHIKEFVFYNNLMALIDNTDNPKWSPKFLGIYNNNLVLEDLTKNGYRQRNKFTPFDLKHCREALKSLASFHAGSFIYNNSNNNQTNIENKYEEFLKTSGFSPLNPWYEQCMLGSLEALKTTDKFKNLGVDFDEKWKKVWNEALNFHGGKHFQMVLSHRDLWNNNIFFHYNTNSEPDACVFVDYQAIKCQPPAGDVLMLLFYNLDKYYLNNYLNELINYYYDQLTIFLKKSNFNINCILPRSDFDESVVLSKKWALVRKACLIPQVWFDDTQITKMFSDPIRCEEVHFKNKSKFIIDMMKQDEIYKNKVMATFEDIINEYIFQK